MPHQNDLQPIHLPTGSLQENWDYALLQIEQAPDVRSLELRLEFARAYALALCEASVISIDTNRSMFQLRERAREQAEARLEADNPADELYKSTISVEMIAPSREAAPAVLAKALAAIGMGTAEAEPSGYAPNTFYRVTVEENCKGKRCVHVRAS